MRTWHRRGWAVGVLALACGGLLLGLRASGDDRDDRGDEDRGTWNAVFTLTNEPDENRLAVFKRDGQGRLSAPEFVPTGGDGTGTGLGNQGALALGDDRRTLYAVNPGSDSITVFRLTPRGPQVSQVISSGGKRPVSIAAHTNRLYVLNAGGAVGDEDCVTGFRVRGNGRLVPLDGSKQRLSASDTGPAQVAFSRHSDVLVVTERATNKIGLIAIDRNGLPEGQRFVDSVGATPFGFEFTRRGVLVVSEAFGGQADASAVSSYTLGADEGTLSVVSRSVPTTETAACWIAITRNGEHAYTTNTASNTVTGYGIDRAGKLTRLTDDGVTAETGRSPTDMTTLDNRALYVLNRNDGSVGLYRIRNGGALESVQVVGGLFGENGPNTFPTGLAVR